MALTSSYNMSIACGVVLLVVVYLLYVNVWFYKDIYSNSKERDCFQSAVVVSVSGKSQSSVIAVPVGFLYDRVSYAKLGVYDTSYYLQTNDGGKSWFYTDSGKAQVGGPCADTLLITTQMEDALSQFKGQNTVTIPGSNDGTFAGLKLPCTGTSNSYYVYVVIASRRV